MKQRSDYLAVAASERPTKSTTRGKRKTKPKDKPITAQAIGEPYSVHTSTSLKPLEHRSKGFDAGPAGTLQYGDGCYRRIPRFFK